MTARITKRLTGLKPLFEGDPAVFGDDDAHGQWRRRIVLSAADYMALGEPEQITVTIEPGDRLNEGQS